MTRREARETAFALLFEWSFKSDETLEDIIGNAAVGRQLEVDDFARSLSSRAVDNVESLDSLIKEYSDKWKINRISKVSLAVLRLAFCELSLFPDIPAGATINEAVELVKTYATDEEAAYVNGILGTYERRRNAAETGKSEPGSEDA